LKNFALTGAAGYVAPRHLKAIKETGNQLLAAVDPFDSVGIFDSFFPDCAFFTEYERFERYLEKLKRKSDSERIHFLSICSPNHLHDAHIRTALHCRADAICEKPLVLNPWNLDALKELEEETGQRVWVVLQLRVHPSLVSLKEKLDSEAGSGKQQVRLTYVTSRGRWYMHSWKGITEKSGGLATNIGVHFFDMLTWLFGDMEHLETHVLDKQTCSGVLELEKAHVKWFLSIDTKHLPDKCRAIGQKTYRSIILDDQEIEFSEGFTELHNEVYRKTLIGEGFGMEDTRQAIEIVHRIRTETTAGLKHNSHPFLK